MSDLLASKFRLPPIAPKWIQRSHLRQRLDEGLALDRQVTLVSAPAGFGKTTCIADWVNSLEQYPVAWLSLDALDDDPGRFFIYLVAALQQVDESLGQEIVGVIRSGEMPSGEIISTALINDIEKVAGRFLLVLDDFHVIQDPLILQVMEQWIVHCPDPLHLILITREDPPLPLARLRANNQLTEIRASDLRFSCEDVGHFLQEVMGLSLSQADIAALEEKTEGWIVGVQLAGLSMRERGNASQWIANLSGGHRHILDYLTEQVIEQQPEEIRQFLCQTSILDRLNGDLCNAVTGRSDSAELLEGLLRANLFLIPLDDERQWYRYHHLFAELLRGLQANLEGAKSSVLHRRASDWFARAGMLNEAIQHALAGKDYAAATGLLESHALEMIMRGYARTVNGWVQSLPEEWRLRSARTSLAFAWSLLLRGDYVQIAEYLKRLRPTLIDTPSGHEHNAMRAEWMVMQSLYLFMQGQLPACQELVASALELLPEQERRVRSLAYFVLGSVAWSQDKHQQAEEYFHRAIRESQAAGNPVAEMMSTTSLAGMALEQAKLHQAYEITSQAAERIERSGVFYPVSAVIYDSLGDVYLQWHQIDQARECFQKALHLSGFGGSNTTAIFCHVMLSRLAHVEGNLDGAFVEVQKAVDGIPVVAPAYVHKEVIAQQVRILLAQDRPAAARLALQRHGFSFEGSFSFPEFPAGENISSSDGALYNSGLRLLLYQAQADPDTHHLVMGVDVAGRLLARALHSRQILVAMETLLLRGQMLHVLGASRESRADILQALAMVEPEGFIGIFIEQGRGLAERLHDLYRQNQLEAVSPGYVEQILKGFAPDGSISGSRQASGEAERNRETVLIEPLTERELEVLQSIAEGLKYKEIAARFFISHNTVRYHVKAIYGKLNVNNRIQAIAVAREHHIL